MPCHAKAGLRAAKAGSYLRASILVGTLWLPWLAGAADALVPPPPANPVERDIATISLGVEKRVLEKINELLAKQAVIPPGFSNQLEVIRKEMMGMTVDQLKKVSDEFDKLQKEREQLSQLIKRPPDTNPAAPAELKEILKRLAEIETKVQAPPMVKAEKSSDPLMLVLLGVAIAGVAGVLVMVLQLKSAMAATTASAAESVKGQLATLQKDLNEIREAMSALNALAGKIENSVAGVDEARQRLAEAAGQFEKLVVAQEEAMAREGQKISGAVENFPAQAERALGQIKSALEETVRKLMRTELDHQSSLISEKLDKAPIEALGQETRQLAVEVQAAMENLQSINRKFEAMNQSMEQFSGRLKQRDETLEGAVWPEPFHQGQALFADRQNIELRVQNTASGAAELIAKMAVLNQELHHKYPDNARVADALHSLSLRAYEFWKDNDIDAFEVSQNWCQAFNQLLAERHIPLLIEPVFSDSRFDAALMLAAPGSSENRIKVKDTLSWAIREQVGESKKVLKHALVITC
jgi:tetrahydromethanopterin S-methyltransferase subunit G